LKRGVIIYTTGEAPVFWTDDNERVLKRSIPGVEAVEIITTRTGHYDVMDAWRSLQTMGMAHVECRMATFTENGELRDTGRVLRLCG